MPPREESLNQHHFLVEVVLVPLVRELVFEKGNLVVSVEGDIHHVDEVDEVQFAPFPTPHQSREEEKQKGLDLLQLQGRNIIEERSQDRVSFHRHLAILKQNPKFSQHL